GDNRPAVEARSNGLEARNRAAQAWVESLRFETEVVSALIALNKSTSTLWERRYTAVTGKNAEEQRVIIAEFSKSREQLKPWLAYTQQQLELYQAAEREQESRLAKIDERNHLRAAELDLLEAIRLQRHLAERQKTSVEQADLVRKSWLEDIERIQQSRSFSARFKNGAGIFADIFQHVWSFELFAVEDTVEVAGQKVVTSRGVTVGKSVGAILLFIIGYLIAAFLGRRAQRIMVARFRVGVHQANVIRRWLLALTIFILLIVTLNLARIPLTVFAFMGGALAIGVGFGTQTLIKNFICGILILLERNVKVGDTIDVDGVVGRVVTVDIRASTILGFDGIETVIPNSMFLENKVTNWTHTNNRLRRIVRVGVSYGSTTKQVRDILVECGKEHGKILKNPPPEALLEDFGDNALVFALYFWVEHGPETNPLQVASDVRFMIEQRFAEENIAIAFPQRDIHLDAHQPLRIEVVT
ncbi:MAG: mechanosensitive ion channel, partial [Desulfuromonadaceae bacterium]|nr:mechanosensitive ion channel [Desulfuromonadaceae bacterium]